MMITENKIPEPQAQEMVAAKRPHDIFLSNLMVNHIVLFTAISAFGPRYLHFMVLIPIISIMVLSYIFYRSSKVKQEDSEFVYIHWQIARRWSKLFIYVLLLLAGVSLVGWLANQYLGLMQEAVYGLIGGFGILPTLITVLALIVIESDSLNHARTGTIPKWALKRFLGIETPATDD